MRQRDENIDKSKGIGIILMILGHSILLTGNFANIAFNAIYSFHMPLFFLYSGYYFSDKKVTDVVKVGLKKLVKPYIVVASIGIIVLSFVSLEDAGRHLRGCIIGTVGSPVSKIRFYTWQAGPIWFLLALFWCKLYYTIIYKISSRGALWISLALSVISILICYYIVNVPLCIGAGMTVVLFYAIGHYINKKGGISKVRYKYLFVILWIVSIFFTTLNTAQYTYKCFPVNIPASLGGILLIYLAVSQATGWIGNFLSWLGRNTMAILGCHSIAFSHSNSFLILFGFDKSNPLAYDMTLLLLTLSWLTLYFFYKTLFPKVYEKIRLSDSRLGAIRRYIRF